MADHAFWRGAGLRDEGLLVSALARLENLVDYQAPDAAPLAASYAFGIARDHHRVDCNTRTALETASVFLLETGHELVTREADAVVTVFALAAGELSEEQLADWIRANSVAA
jgi:death on curing protein